VQRGQLSLEYLLLLLAVFAVFSFLVPLLTKVYNVALFGLDSANAKQFTQSIASAVDEMRFLSDGSAKSIVAKPFTSWVVSSNGKGFTVTVKSEPLAAEKQFVVALPNKLDLQELSFQGSMLFLVKKSGGTVLIEYN